MASLKSPQPPPAWQHPVEDLPPRHLLETKRSARTSLIPTTSLALANPEAAFDIAIGPLSFYQNVTTDKVIRDVSTKSEERARKYANQESMREDQYKAKVTEAANLRKTGAWDALSAEQKRLSKEEREKLMRLKDDPSEACLKFTQNFNEENGRISFTREQLDGVPEDVISGYTQRIKGDKVLYEVTIRTPDVFPLFKYANDPQTREAAQQAFDDRLANNVDTRIPLSIYVKMVKSAANAKKFLDDLKAHLDPLGTQERATLLGLKKGGVYQTYYDRLYVERNLDLDDSLVKEYFPVSVVVPAIPDIYQNLLGVKFVEVTGDARDVWHPEVQQFAVWEKDVKDESGFAEYCYLDPSLATQQPLSDDLIAKIIKSRYVNVGLFYLRQLFFGNFDLAVHNNSFDVNTDYTKFWNDVREKISLVQGGEYKPGQGTFGHVVGGYDAGYYGYYSLVFAADMYATVFKKAPLDPVLGRLYRDKILFVGGSRDDMDSLKDLCPRQRASLIMDRPDVWTLGPFGTGAGSQGVYQ
ncbi:hypothetical protein JVT61DRAFT_8456 [Boletus reticuloceps]|uniref:Peptidase M3A/M3B catalytic domain-containing protein n=1 Tax=Boletus reticuloceps TaxID=495285 RepID=A0A8I3AFD6_9AGAM|nr:hypothetical protein JVT61DRAFT_8456 [Boletus reticuloceps]